MEVTDTILRDYPRPTRGLISSINGSNRTIGTLKDPKFACFRSDISGLVNLLGAYCASIMMHRSFIQAFNDMLSRGLFFFVCISVIEIFFL